MIFSSIIYQTDSVYHDIKEVFCPLISAHYLWQDLSCDFVYNNILYYHKQNLNFNITGK